MWTLLKKESECFKKAEMVGGAEERFTHHAEAVFDRRETYGPPGVWGLLINSYVVLWCRLCNPWEVSYLVTIKAWFLSSGSCPIFVSVLKVDDTASEGGSGKAPLTAMIESVALVSVHQQEWIADNSSHKFSVLIAAVIFTIGSA